MSEFIFLTPYWPSFLFGIFGLAFRWSRMGLPNGGTEPHNAFEQFVRLFKLWVEATVGSFVMIALVFIAKIFYPVVGDFIFILLALASMLGAAMSDALGKIIQNPTGTFDWVRDTVMKWFGK